MNLPSADSLPEDLKILPRSYGNLKLWQCHVWAKVIPRGQSVYSYKTVVNLAARGDQEAIHTLRQFVSACIKYRLTK